MNDTELSKRLKEYFVKIEEIYGEDVAYATAARSDSISESLNYYSDGMFADYDEEDICLELLISELLCNKGENLMVNEARKLSRKAPENYMQDFESYPGFKPILLRSFIKNSSKSYASRLKQLEEDNTKVLDAIQAVSSYQLARHIENTKNNDKPKELLKEIVIL